MLRRRRGDGAFGAARARSRAARTSASTHPERDDDGYLKHSLASCRRRRPAGDRLLRRDDHALAAGAARLWGSRRMTETVTLEVLRYRPETDSEPHFQTYTVPYHEDWVVLDALNHVKDHVDSTLVLPLVLPHGGVRQLRHDGQRRAEAARATPSCATTAARRSASSRSTTSRSSATSSSSSTTSWRS